MTDLEVNEQASEEDNLLSEVIAREEALKSEQAQFVAEKIAFEKKMARADKKSAKQELSTNSNEPLEGDFIPANRTGTFVTLKTDHTFQVGMPSRQELLVTMNFKRGQIVKDPQLVQTLIETGAPITIG